MITMVAALATAHASDGARLRIDNAFDGEAQVLVDGRFVAMVGGDTSVEVPTRPGRHEVSVVRPGTGFVLASTRVQLVPDVLVVVPVAAPKTTLRVENQGEIALKVTVEGQNLWLSPRTRVEVPVTSGNVSLTAMAHEPRGDFFAASRAVWVEPGQLGSTVLSPDPTVLVVDNNEIFDMRILLDGRDAGEVEGGEVQRMWIRPGPTVVTLIDPFGNVRSETRLVVQKGQDARVVLAGPMSAFDHQPFGPQRPPPNPTWTHTGTGGTVVTLR